MFMYLYVTFIIWAIQLIYDDGIFHIVRDNVFKSEVGSDSNVRIMSCFDSNAVTCACEGTVPYSQSNCEAS